MYTSFACKVLKGLWSSLAAIKRNYNPEIANVNYNTVMTPEQKLSNLKDKIEHFHLEDIDAGVEIYREVARLLFAEADIKVDYILEPK